MSLLGSIFNKNQSTDDQNTTKKNLSSITEDKAKELIKTLSGGEVRYTKKIIDNLVVMTGASGGTGVSTILANVAYLAAARGLRVLVIDLNIMYPSQHLYFSKEQSELNPPDLMGFLTGKISLGEAINNQGSVSLLCTYNKGLMDSLVAEGDIAVSNMNTAMQKVRQLFDLVLIDCPMKIEHTLCNAVFYACDAIYIVWDEGIGSITNTEKIRRNMAASGIDAYTKMRAILNKRTDVHYNKYPFEKLNLELVEILPFDTSVIYSSLRSEIFCEKGSSSSKNANTFYHNMEDLTDRILVNGGFVK